MSTPPSSTAASHQKKKQAVPAAKTEPTARTSPTARTEPTAITTPTNKPQGASKDKKVKLDDPGTAIPEDLSPLEQLRREREKARLRLERLKAEQLKAQVVTEQLHNERLKAEKMAEMAMAEERKAEVISEQKVAAELKAKKEAKLREKALKEALMQAEKIKAEQAAIEQEAEERREEQKRLKQEAAKLRKEKEEAQKLVERQEAARKEAEERAAAMQAQLQEEEARERRLAEQLEEQERQAEAARRRVAQDRKLKAARQRDGQSPVENIPSPDERRRATEVRSRQTASPQSAPSLEIPALKSGDTGQFVTRDTLDPEAIMMQKIVDDLDAGYQPVKSQNRGGYGVSNKPSYHEDKSFPTINIAVAIVQKKNKFLLVQEKKGWYFPAGRPVGNESMVEAAKRETLYKGGLEVEAKGVVRVEHTIMPKYARLRSIFLCRQTCTNEPKQEANAQSFKAAWFELRDLEKIKLRTNEVLPIMEALLDGYTVAPLSFYTIEGAPW